MRVGELSATTGVSVRSIRHYERAGLLDATRRANGYREFDPTSVDRVRVIRDLIDSGFTVEEIGSLASCLYGAEVSGGCCARTVSLFRTKLARIDDQLRTLLRQRDRIEKRVASLEPC